GFVLGPLLEEHLRRAMIISRGDPMIFIERPISATLLAMALAAVVVAVLPSIRRKRAEVFVEEDGFRIPPPSLPLIGGGAYRVRFRPQGPTFYSSPFIRGRPGGGDPR